MHSNRTTCALHIPSAGNKKNAGIFVSKVAYSQTSIIIIEYVEEKQLQQDMAGMYFRDAIRLRKTVAKNRRRTKQRYDRCV